MITRIIQKIFRPTFGKKKFQKFFESLYQFSLLGMNIGGGADPADSGEKFVLRYVRDRLGPMKTMMVFDVGANVGYYSELLREALGDTAIIHSFEPSLKTYQQLAARIPASATSILHNVGLGETEKNTVLYTDQDASGLASIYKRRLDHFGVFMDKSEDIATTTIDAFCKNNDITHIHFLKLDVEGHEMKVLEGASRLLCAKEVDFIQFEFGGCNIDSRTYFQDFYYMLKDNYDISGTQRWFVPDREVSGTLRSICYD